MMKTWLIAALLCLPLQASAQELWRGARAGDTPAQVQAKFPQVKVSDEPNSLPGRSAWRLDKIRMAGIDSEANFVFEHDALLSVILSFKARDIAGMETTYAALIADMYATHGPPESCGGTATLKHQCLWQVNGAEIGVARWHFGDESGFVNMWHKAAATKSGHDE
jgi:hypothetical protein